MNRRDYLLRKFGLSLVTILVVVVINFLLFRVLPGDPVRAVVGRNVRISAETQQALREQFGLDKPVFPDQFFDTLGQWARGNLGVSWSLRPTERAADPRDQLQLAASVRQNGWPAGPSRRRGCARPGRRASGCCCPFARRRPSCTPSRGSS